MKNNSYISDNTAIFFSFYGVYCKRNTIAKKTGGPAAEKWEFMLLCLHKNILSVKEFIYGCSD